MECYNLRNRIVSVAIERRTVIAISNQSLRGSIMIVIDQQSRDLIPRKFTGPSLIELGVPSANCCRGPVLEAGAGAREHHQADILKHDEIGATVGGSN